MSLRTATTESAFPNYDGAEQNRVYVRVQCVGSKNTHSLTSFTQQRMHTKLKVVNC